MKNSKRAIALFLAVMNMFAVSCGNNATQTTDSTTASDGTDTTVGGTETAEVPEIPDDKYEGYEFRILGVEKATGAKNSEIAVETENGETLNDAVYNRNRMVEERFGIKISHIVGDYSNIVSGVGKTVLAGEDAYDAAVDTTAFISSGIVNQYILPITDVPYIDIEKSWWSTDVIEASAVNGKPYFLMGDINYSWKDSTWVLCFNKRLYKEYGLEEPYSMVREGKWTLDLLEEHCRDITKDLNGDSKLDKEDQWGLLSSKTAGIGLVTSTGITTVTAGKDGSLEYVLENERNINVLGTIRKFITNNDLQLRAEDITGSSNIWSDIIGIFRAGRALYRISIMSDVTGLRDMNDDFGILPLPKYDEDQENYYTTYQSWNGRAYVIPASVTDLGRAGAIIEYMGAVSKDTITKAYYDVTLNGKVARDDDSSEMLDIIFNSAMTTDIGLAFELGGLRQTLPSIINSDTDNVASTLASNKESIISSIKDFEDSAKG